MAWLTKITCKNCLMEHILVTENKNSPRPGDEIEYTCPENESLRKFYDQGKDKCNWDEVISIKVSSQQRE